MKVKEQKNKSEQIQTEINKSLESQDSKQRLVTFIQLLIKINEREKLVGLNNQPNKKPL